MYHTPEVLVIGAGISGLSTAVCLVESGHTVQVLTRDLPGATTSCAAGAIWGPYLLTDERELRWSNETRRELARIAQDEPDSGVRLVAGREVSREVIDRPAWTAPLEDFAMCTASDLPAGYNTGWRYTAPVVDMPRYLDYLLDRLRSAGGEIAIEIVDSLADATIRTPVVVNCTGYGARKLAADPLLTRTRGQLVVVKNPGISTFFAEYDDSPTPTYFLPHGDDHVVLGGSAESGRVDLEPDLATSAAIQARCALVEPSIERARVIEHRVGLRPSRPQIRLEREAVGSGHVIHNYGHSGSGVTVSWGCAREVARLIEEL